MGKPMPLSALGLARIGGNIMAGPWINGDLASFGISFGVPANPSGTRKLYEIALDNQVAWEAPLGASTLAGGTFLAEAFTARWYSGTLTQGADALETANYGAEAVAYRPQMLLFFENLPLTAFGGKIPYVAAVIGDTTGGADPYDGINLGEAIERIAYSPWALYTSDTFDTAGIVDVVGAILLADNLSIVQLCQNISSIYVNLDLLQSDKLWLKDHGAIVSPDLVLDLDTILSADAPVSFTRRAPSTVPRELELITIDPDADYTWVPSKAQRPRAPVVVSASVGKQTITLPIVTDASTRTAMVHYAEYVKENARKTVSFTTLAYGLEIEPGDLVGLQNLSDGFEDEIFKLTETTHGANFVVACQAEAIMRCALGIEGGSSAHVICYNATINPADTTKTFSASNLGAADANRKIIVAIELRTTNLGTAFSSVTIGGVAATQHAVASSGGLLLAAVYSAAVPTGATGDIVINTSGTFHQATVNIYRKVSATIALHDSASANGVGGSISINIDVPVNGLLIAGAATRSGNLFTWSGATADCTFANDADTTGQRAGASYAATAAESGRTVTITTSFDRLVLAAASFTA